MINVHFIVIIVENVQPSELQFARCCCLLWTSICVNIILLHFSFLKNVIILQYVLSKSEECIRSSLCNFIAKGEHWYYCYIAVLNIRHSEKCSIMWLKSLWGGISCKGHHKKCRLDLCRYTDGTDLARKPAASLAVCPAMQLPSRDRRPPTGMIYHYQFLAICYH